jgi:GT2 family glycosyltransferase/lipopolysaccharide/colanic/teichoic acid biosynthesis glycosyltransferase
MKFDISIVIVNYNVRAFLEQCLMAIDRARHNFNIEIFVVDNASVDGSQAMVKRNFPEVQLIEQTKNLGFSKANNQALKLAKGRFVLILNPDTLIQEDSLLVLKKFLDDHPEAGAVGCKLLNPDGSFQIGCRRTFPTPWVAFSRIIGLSKIFPKSTLFGKYNMTYLDSQIETEVDVLMGSLMFIRRDVLKKVGYFDEDYFMYGEDIDLCYKIKKEGWKIFYTPATQAIHYKGESTKKGEFSYVSNFYSAMLIFANKHLKTRYSIFLRILLTLGIYSRAAIAYSWRIFKDLLPSLLDLLIITGSVLVAMKIRFPYYPFSRFRVIFPVYTIIWFICTYIFTTYYRRRKYHLKPVFWASIAGLSINSTFTYFFKEFVYSRFVVLISFIFILFLLSLWRFIYRLIMPFSEKGALSKMRRAIIIGAGKEGKRILEQLQKRPDIQYEICGFVEFEHKHVGKEIDGAEVLATIDNVKDVIRVENITDVIFSSDRLTNAQILETIVRAQGSGVNFRIVPHELEYIVAKSSVDEIDTVPLLDIKGVADPLDLFVKRLFDIILSLTIIIFTAPLLFINFVLGGKLIEEEVSGYAGQPIKIKYFKGGLGFLENLPLYFSVFSGALSVVGSEITKFKPSEYHTIFKPGITGLVQIKSREKKEALTRKEKDYYNLYYVRNQSIITDLHIILKSIF